MNGISWTRKLFQDVHCLVLYSQLDDLDSLTHQVQVQDMGRKLWPSVRLCSFWRDRLEAEARATAVHVTSTHVEWPVTVSLIITLDGKRQA